LLADEVLFGLEAAVVKVVVTADETGAKKLKLRLSGRAGSSAI
jgi:hypothetical protein